MFIFYLPRGQATSIPITDHRSPYVYRLHNYIQILPVWRVIVVHNIFDILFDISIYIFDLYLKDLDGDYGTIIRNCIVVMPIFRNKIIFLNFYTITINVDNIGARKTSTVECGLRLPNYILYSAYYNSAILHTVTEYWIVNTIISGMEMRKQNVIITNLRIYSSSQVLSTKR